MKYIAYVTLASQTDKGGSYIIDAVAVQTLGTNGDGKLVYAAHRMDYVGVIQWTPSGKLVIGESIWEGTWVLFIYDPITDEMLTKLRADEPSLHWNPQRTAFYAVHTGEYGAETCVRELGGYDFEISKPLRDLFEAFNIPVESEGAFGIPHAVRNSLYVEPYAWSSDGERLWVTATPLLRNADDLSRYEVGPKQAGVIELSETGSEYVALAADPHFDYSFEGLSDPKIISTVYQSRLCP
jgi:hypothetical protein